jgi:hypothetical protein
MSSERRLAAGLRGAAAIGTLWLAAFAPPTAGQVQANMTPAASASTVTLSPTKLMAAPALGSAGAVEVRLRWTVTDGWLPDGGFNVYRADRSGALNALPLGAGAAVSAPAQLDIGGARPLELKALLIHATAVSSGTVLPHLTASVARAASATVTFDQLGAQAMQTQALKGPRLSGSTNATNAAAASAAANAPVAAASTHALLVNPTPAQLAVDARRTLLLAATLHPAVGDALGLSFDDKTVTVGQSVRYELRPISGGREMPAVASVSFVVPTGMDGLKPPAPTGLRAQQLDATRVAMRWERLSPLAEALMGVAGYDVYRTSPGRPRVKLNKVPVLVFDTANVDADGNATNVKESPSFYVDLTPALGSVTYELTVTDVFGRTSDPARVAITVQDWRKPRAVTLAQAQLQVPASAPAGSRSVSRVRPFLVAPDTPPKLSALVAWTPSPDQSQGVNYRVYRVDTELGTTQQPVLLTTAPLAGDALAGASLPAGTIREALAAQTCLVQVRKGVTIPGTQATALATGSRGKSGAKSGAVQPAPIGPCGLNRLTPANRAQAEQFLLEPVQVLTYTDATAQPDHYYRYYVAAVFTRNNEEATPIQTNVVAQPDLTPPSAPGNLASSFELSPAPASGAAAPQDLNTKKTALAATGLTLSNWSGPLVRAQPRNLGGTLNLSWTASPRAKAYEVYRAYATRLAPSVAAPTTGSAGACTGSSSAQTLMVGGHAVTVSSPVCIGKPVLAALTWKAPLKDADFVLLGTTTDTRYADPVGRSSAQYYTYRVVPLNRWKVPGVMAELAARAPATMPPTAPKLLAGTAAPDGGVQIEYAPVLDSGEEVVRYELWRFPLGQPVSGTTTVSSGTAAAAPASTTSASSASSAANASGTGTSKSGAIGATSGSAQVAAARTSGLLSGAAGRYGVVMRQPVLSAALRAGDSSVQSRLLADMTQGMKVAETAANATAAGNGQVGSWLAEAGSASLSWRNDYAYWVKAVDQDGLSSDSQPIDVTPLKFSASAPTNVAASWNAGECAVNVSWQTADPDTAGFIVERELQPGSVAAGGGTTATAQTASGQTIITGLQSMNTTATLQRDDYAQLSGITAPSATSVVDHSVFPDNAYLYRVRTLDQAGNLSAPVVTATAVAVPDGCGSTGTRRITARPAPTATQPDTDTPVVTPPAPVVPKPADEIDISPPK